MAERGEDKILFPFMYRTNEDSFCTFPSMRERHISCTPPSFILSTPFMVLIILSFTKIVFVTESQFCQFFIWNNMLCINKC